LPTFLSANICNFIFKQLELWWNTEVVQLQTENRVTVNLFSAVEMQIFAYDLANFNLQNSKIVFYIHLRRCDGTASVPTKLSYQYCMFVAQKLTDKNKLCRSFDIFSIY